MAKAYFRFRSVFKERLVESKPTGDGSIEGLAIQAGIDHSPLHHLVTRYHAGDWTLDIARVKAITLKQNLRSPRWKKMSDCSGLSVGAETGAHRRPR